jgi:TolB-like protein/Tfp pilus assembly protein PilF
MSIHKFGQFELDRDKRLLFQVGGTIAPLAPKAYDTLAYLVARAGTVVDKDELMRAVWPDTAVEENNLTQNISTLRRVLGESRNEHRYIVTVPGRGYQFVANVTENDGSYVETPTGGPAIAVLPFVNVTGDAEYEFFVDGIVDELISALSKLPGLRVAARTSAFSFKGRQAHVHEIAAQLGVSIVLEGSVRKSGGRLRVSAQLVNADGYQLWSERYDREIEMRDLFDVQDEIVVAVMDALKVKLPGQDRAAVLRHSTENTQAHELYLKGRFHLFHLTAAGIERGLKCFEKAIEIDPMYPPPYVGLAHAYRMFGLSLDMPTSEVGPKAKEAALKAVEIDDTLAEAHAVLGFTLYWSEWNVSEAARHFRRALALSPNSVDSLWMYAHLPSNLGDHDEALQLIARAHQLDPLSGLIHAMEGQFLLHAGRVSEAVERLEEAIDLDPKSRVAHLFASSAYIEAGRYDDAIAEARASYELAPSNTQPLAFEGYAHAKAGRRSEACTLLEKLLEMDRNRYIPRQNIALLYNALDDPTEALSWLERAVEQRDFKLVFLKVEPKWKNLRGEPRFAVVLRRINLLPASPPAS